MSRVSVSLATTMVVFALGLFFTSDGQVPGENNNDSRVAFTAEFGFVAPLQHRIQFSRTGTYFSYVEEGGQDVLFPVARLVGSLTLGRHTAMLLYQPLRLENIELLERDLLIDELLFPANTPVRFLYNFPFFRASYLYQLPVGPEQLNLSVGLSLQIRNATIAFESLDGELFRTNRDVGLVPALKLHSQYDLTERVWLALEADGIYAPVSYLNGDNNDVTGAILDASVRAGWDVRDPFSLFLNLRYLGGGAEGDSEDDDGPGDGYVRNWLHFMTVTLGFVFRL